MEWRPIINKASSHDTFVYQSDCDRFLLIGEYDSSPKNGVKRTIKIVDLGVQKV